ncbi:serine carboxypeptidase-like 2 isoform X2 [Papaver somniferum]|uniref:serine carboxypeptidase-like 2 isoform X2 n=1 Tax=Papaver somniferum TaxID=3469 RepID=UPI000E6FB4E4|nr:serine carboxypeptidase-like 2 isoform X2 [Papaver somniferum]
MAGSKNKLVYSSYSLYPNLLRLVFIIVIISVSGSSHEVSNSTAVIKYLPGFSGPLPFYFETGYIGVDEKEDVQLFYYFVKSERNPMEDPVMLWLTGGPGCSAFSGLVYEIGPLKFDVVEYKGSLPTLVQNPYSWTKVASIIFLDSPVGTGFSYSRSQHGWMTSDLKSANQAYQFLKKWLIIHPEFTSNPIYISGDSYSGLPVPVIVQHILDGNEAGHKPFINVKGIVLGNAVTEPTLEGNSKIPFVHGMGLISEELYESLKKTCEGEYTNVSPSNTLCQRDLNSYYQYILGINTVQVLEPACYSIIAPANSEKITTYRRSMSEKHSKWPIQMDQDPQSPVLACRSYGYLLSSYWINNDTVREALHIRNGTVDNWKRCNYGLQFEPNLGSSFSYHVNLSKRGSRSLIYSGDHDMVVPHLGTQAWIRLLNYTIVDDWRSWWVDGEVAGYTRKYSNEMTFATVKGGGHTAPEYKPKEALAMFKRWIDSEPV